MPSLTPHQRLAQEILIRTQVNPPKGFESLGLDVRVWVVAAALSACGVKCSVHHRHYLPQRKAPNASTHVSSHHVLCVDRGLMTAEGRVSLRELVEKDFAIQYPPRAFQWDPDCLVSAYTPGRQAGKTALREAYSGHADVVRYCIDTLAEQARQLQVLDATPPAPAQRKGMRL